MHTAQLQEVFTQVADASIESLAAQSYIKNGDFWFGKDAKATFSIDGSRVPDLELAIDWYDRAIAEFPGSSAANLAFQRKLFALLGWRTPDGRYYGLVADFDKFMPLLLKTFSEYEAAFPKEAHLQGFRYQIAQAYSSIGLTGPSLELHSADWPNTRLWLNKIIEAGGEQRTFYTETAKARLKAGR